MKRGMRLGHRMPQQLRVNGTRFAWNNDTELDEGGKNDDIPALIEQLIASGAFTSADKAGLQALPPDTLRAIAEKFSGGEIEEVVTKTNRFVPEEDHSDFIHAGRPQSLRRELPEERASRNYRVAYAQHRKAVANSTEDEVARGMVPPSSRRPQ